MKISKTLLQAILVGVTIGTTTTSCSMLDSITGGEEEICEEGCIEEGGRSGVDGGHDSCWDCPGCGLG